MCREIRRSDPHTPILFFTAMAHAQIKNNALEAGATEYPVKPDDLDNLTAIDEKISSQKSSFFQERLLHAAVRDSELDHRFEFFGVDRLLGIDF